MELRTGTGFLTVMDIEDLVWGSIGMCLLLVVETERLKGRERRDRDWRLAKTFNNFRIDFSSLTET